MQTYQFSLETNQRPETLERILRVIRHRGFSVVAMKMSAQQESATMNFTVQSDRTFDLLANQLAKLYDVVRVNF